MNALLFLPLGNWHDGHEALQVKCLACFFTYTMQIKKRELRILPMKDEVEFEVADRVD